MAYCGICGAQYSPERITCPACGKPVPHLKSLALSAVGLESVASPRTRRLLAGLVDLGIVVGGITLSLVLARRLAAFPLPVGARIIPAIIFQVAYLLLKDSIEGKSVGKFVAGIVVYNVQERRPAGPLDSIQRNSYLAIPIVGPTIFAAIIGFQIALGFKRRVGDGEAYLVISNADHKRLA